MSVFGPYLYIVYVYTYKYIQIRKVEILTKYCPCLSKGF